MAAVLSLLLVLGMFAVLVGLGVVDLDRGASGGGMLVAVRLGSAADKPRAVSHAAHAAKAAVRPAAPVVPQPPAFARIATPNVAPSAAPSGGFIHMTHDEMAMADIGRTGPPANATGAAGGDPGKTYGPGEGPGGRHLYPADWYREPSDAEIGPYMKQGAPPGSWADIACKTVEHYHVEDCQEIAESPPGSGLARGLRQAAWQFLVRPPLVNGVPQLGTWVRIHFSFTRRPGEDNAP